MSFIRKRRCSSSSASSWPQVRTAATNFGEKDLIEGLKYAHDHNAIHRDIKPENILFAAGSTEPVICDFGIAHFAEEDLLTVVETKGTDRMANFQYAAPEQKRIGGNVCPQTDIYAIALILNEMFTGEIPQAAGYKKIAEVNEEYKYLDDLFDLLFKQKPEDRLYPVTTILSELKLLTEQYKRDKEKERLKTVVSDLVAPKEFKPSLINAEFKDNNLIFTLDANYPDEWFRILTNGSYDHSYLMGHDTNNLEQAGLNEFSMPLRGYESAETIKSIFNNVKDWIAKATFEYCRLIKNRAIEEQRRKEQTLLP